MKKTIQNRIFVVLVTAIGLVAFTGGFSLYYLSRVSHDLKELTQRDLLVVRSAEKIEQKYLDLKRLERDYFSELQRGETPNEMDPALDSFQAAINEQKELSVKEMNKKRLEEILSLHEDYKKILQDASSKSGASLFVTQKNARELSQKIKDMIGEFLSRRYLELEEHEAQIDIVISNTHRNMILFIFIATLGGIILVLIAPSRVTAPFRKFIAAIQEVEDLSSDSHLPITGYDEVAQVAQSVNRLIDRFRTFDDIKTKRIQFESRKQRVLANMVDLGVMMLTVEGHVSFMNTQLAKLLNLKTDGYQNKDYRLVSLPEELKDMVQDVLKRKQRIDSRMMILMYRGKATEEEQAVECNVDAGLVRNYEGDIVNIIITFEDITNPLGKSAFKRISFKEQELI